MSNIIERKSLNELKAATYEEHEWRILDAMNLLDLFAYTMWHNSKSYYNEPIEQKLAEYGWKLNVNENSPVSFPQLYRKVKLKSPKYFQKNAWDDFCVFVKEAAKTAMDNYAKQHKDIASNKYEPKEMANYLIGKIKKRYNPKNLVEFWDSVVKFYNLLNNKLKDADNMRKRREYEEDEKYTNPDKWVIESKNMNSENKKLYESIMSKVSKQVKKALDEGYIDEPVWGNFKPIKDLKKRNDVPVEVYDEIEKLLGKAYSENITFDQFLEELEIVLNDYYQR